MHTAVTADLMPIACNWPRSSSCKEFELQLVQLALNSAAVHASFSICTYVYVCSLQLVVTCSQQLTL